MAPHKIALGSIRSRAIIIRPLEQDEDGSVGIGNLVIFISTILVAAIAAGILINTINVLEQQAQETGTQAIADISTGIKIVSITGDRKEDGDSTVNLSSDIQVIKLRIRLISGSVGIDIGDVVILVSDGSSDVELTLNTSGTTAVHADANYFVLTAIRDDDSSITTNNQLGVGDLGQIIISTDSSATNMDLDGGTTVTIHIIPNVGITTFSKFTTPSTYTTRFMDLV